MDEPAVEIEAIADDVVERQARTRAMLDGHPVTLPAPADDVAPARPRLQLLR